MKIPRKPLYDNIYNYIVTYKRKHNGVSPTIAQIAAHINKKSSSFVHYRLQEMSNDGRIEYHHKPTSRGIVVSNSTWHAPDVRPPWFPNEQCELLYDKVIEYAKENNGNSPSYRGLKAMTGMSSISLIRHHLKLLHAYGILHVSFGGINRHISVPNSTWMLNHEHQQTN